MVDFPIDYIREKIGEQIKKASEKKEDELWVTDLIYCPLKRAYTEKLMIEINGNKVPPVIAEQLDTPSLVIGDLIHRGLEEWLREKGCQTEEEVEKTVTVKLSEEEKTFKIRGRIDAICGDTVVEIKYMRDIKQNKPLQHHILQTQLYMWLAEKTEGLIIYVSPTGILSYNIRSPYTEPQVRIEIAGAVSMLRIPRYEWECRYCPFQMICPHSPRGGK